MMALPTPAGGGMSPIPSTLSDAPQSTASPVAASSAAATAPGPGPAGEANAKSTSNENVPIPSGRTAISASAPTYTGGHITISPDSIPSGQLNPRSCVTCRRRKVRCDKQMPCSNCRRAHCACVFPAPGRAPRRPRPKDPNAPPKQGGTEREAELMRRLRKLEGIVEELSGQIDVEKHSAAGSGTGDSPEAGPHPTSPAQANIGHIIYGAADDHRPDTRPDRPRNGRGSVASAPVADSSGPKRANRRQGSDIGAGDFGRLVLAEKGKTRYVSNMFWSKLNDELDRLREETVRISEDDSDMSDYEESPPGMVPDDLGGSNDQAGHHGFVLGYSSSEINLRPLHPLVSQIPFLWQIFQENVDPLVKILHIPTMNKTIRDLRSTNMESLTPPNEALMFSIYFAAITSMDDEEVMSTFKTHKLALLKQYRFALEQALAKANFLTSSDIVVLQALVLFLVLVRRHDDTRFSWTMTGLAIRIAHSLGIHRDGVHFPDLTPFEIETRRRLWWAICILDLRSAEDQGTDLTILDRLFDTELPLNINDADITPETKVLPKPRDTHTDITFSLIRYEICVLARRMHTATSLIAPVCPRDAALTLEMREKMLLETHEKVNRKYFKYGTTTDNPMYWVAATVARLILAKLSLIIHQPVMFPPPGTEVSQEIRDRLFVSSMEIVEYNLILHTEPRTKQWRWLFQTYTQWHAVAYLMVDICRRPWSPIVERAWVSLTASFSRGPELARISGGNSTPMIPFRKLFLKTRRHREAEAARLRADPLEAERLRSSERVHVPPARFGVLPTGVNSAMALTRWRELVNPGSQSQSPEPAAGGSGGAGAGARAAPRAQVSQSTPATLAPASAAGETTDTGGMGIVERLMQGSMFDPVELFPAAYPVAGDSVYAKMRDELLATGTIQNDPQYPPPAGSGVGMVANVFSQSGAAPARPPSNIPDPNPPPWLWSDPWGQGETRFPAGGDMEARREGQGRGDGDGDVDMDVDLDIDAEAGGEGDEDFNWDVFQESIRAYDMETGISTAMKAVSGGLGGMRYPGPV